MTDERTDTGSQTPEHSITTTLTNKEVCVSDNITTPSNAEINGDDLVAHGFCVTLVRGCGRWDDAITVDSLHAFLCKDGDPCTQTTIFSAAVLTLNTTQTSLQICVPAIRIDLAKAARLRIVFGNSPDVVFTITPQTQLAALSAALQTTKDAADIIGVVSSLVVPPSQAAAQQTLLVCATITCASEAKVTAGKSSTLSPIPLPIHSPNLCAVVGNTVAIVAVYLIINGLTWGLKKAFPKYYTFTSAAEMIGNPHLFLITFALLHQGSVLFSFKLLMSPDGALEFIVGIIGTVVYAFGVLFGIWWYHRYRFQGTYRLYEFRTTAMRLYLFEGAWGPNSVFNCSCTFVCNFKGKWALWCVAPFVVNTMICFVVALPLHTSKGCVGQFSTVSALLVFTSLFYLIGRPLRWWFLNTANGVSYGLQAVVMACSAVNETQSSQSQTLLLVEMYVALTLSAISCLTSILVLFVVIVEIWKFRKVIWFDSEKHHDYTTRRVESSYSEQVRDMEMQLFSWRSHTFKTCNDEKHTWDVLGTALLERGKRDDEEPPPTESLPPRTMVHPSEDARGDFSVELVASPINEEPPPTELPPQPQAFIGDPLYPTYQPTLQSRALRRKIILEDL